MPSSSSRRSLGGPPSLTAIPPFPGYCLTRRTIEEKITYYPPSPSPETYSRSTSNRGRYPPLSSQQRPSRSSASSQSRTSSMTPSQPSGSITRPPSAQLLLTYTPDRSSDTASQAPTLTPSMSISQRSSTSPSRRSNHSSGTIRPPSRPRSRANVGGSGSGISGSRHSRYSKPPSRHSGHSEDGRRRSSSFRPEFARQ